MNATLEAYRALNDRGIKLSHLMILAALAGQPTGECTAADLAETTGIERSLLSYYYRALTKRGLVALRRKRAAFPATSIRLVRLTPRGLAIAQATRLGAIPQENEQA
jgi:DNA-binding MarR family transcriptional regulator